MKATIGLTGGIASGKSTVARRLAELGAGVIDADALAREVVLPGTDGLREIVAAFGASVLDEHGALDRKQLGAIVFRDPAARATLNGITHPRIAALSAQRIAELQATACPYIVYEAALLVEGGLHHGMAALIVVVTHESHQRARIQARDGLDENAADARIASQLPTAAKVAVADYVIDNNHDLAELIAQTDQVHRAILERFVQLT